MSAKVTASRVLSRSCCCRHAKIGNRSHTDFIYPRLVTLAVQNAMLTLIMHYSRVSAPPSQTYSAAAAVLLTELLKGTISLVVAFTRIDAPAQYPGLAPVSQWSPRALLCRSRRLVREVFRADCWKLSIPAILYGASHSCAHV